MQKQLTAPGLRDQIMVMAILSLKRKKEIERERERERESEKERKLRRVYWGAEGLCTLKTKSA